MVIKQNRLKHRVRNSARGRSQVTRKEMRHVRSPESIIRKFLLAAKLSVLGLRKLSTICFVCTTGKLARLSRYSQLFTGNGSADAFELGKVTGDMF